MFNPKSFFRNKLSLNFIYISLSQIVNYVFPLLTFPYLVKVLGLNGFGLYTFATSFVGYFQLIVDYGFNIIGIKKIAEGKKTTRVNTEVYSSIFFTRMILMLICFILFLTIVLLFSEFRKEFYLYIFSFCTIFTQILIPFWFYQAVEEMKFISIINTISKIISTVLIFFLVKSPDDVEIIPLLYTFSTIVVGVLSYKIIKSKFHVVIDFRYLNIRNIRKYLIDGWHFFVSNISISLYTNTLIFALGLFGTKEQVAYFSIPNKIVGILRMAFEPITQTLFPHFSNLLVSGELKLLKAKIKKVFIAGLIAISGVCIIIFVLSPFILRYLFNVSALESINNLRLQIWLPVILWFHVIFGYFYIVLQKMNKLYSKIILWSSVISIPISFYFINTYKDLGATITLLLVEIGIGLIYVYYYLKTKKTVYGE